MRTRYHIEAKVTEDDPELNEALLTGAKSFGDRRWGIFVRDGDTFYEEFLGRPPVHLKHHYIGCRDIVKVEIVEERECHGQCYPLADNYSRDGAEAKVTHAEGRCTVSVEAPTFEVADDLRRRIFFRCVKPAE